MPEITLAVSSAVIAQVTEGRAFQRQLSIRARSDELDEILNTANGHNRLEVILGNCIRLVVGDTSAIWRSHNIGETAADFDSLYELLNRRPDEGMRFYCEVEAGHAA